MNKRIFVVLIIVMTAALIGIIAVQIYWIKNSISIREKQFSNDVKFALAEVSDNIQEREYNDFYETYAAPIDSARQSVGARQRDFYFRKIDTIRDELFTYRERILENEYETTIPLFNGDTLPIKTFFGDKEKELRSLGKKFGDLSEPVLKERIYEIGRMSKLEAANYNSVFREIAENRPIYDRVTNIEIQANLENELRARGLELPFEFMVTGDGLATKVRSERYKEGGEHEYQVPLFSDNNSESAYQLHVSFPSKEEYLSSSVINTLILAAIFILIIIFTFSSAIYQLLKQKQISEIKTDFINNMTHEFKTPIATINLALDAIKNPKIISDQEKVLKYTKMIREENKRMHGQVENVLRISRLEKNQLELSKGVCDLHDIIIDAATHVDLIVKNKGGYLNLHLDAMQNEVMVDRFHMTNVLMNIFDNAIKYTNDSPKIDVYTENAGNKIVVHVKDQGMGMNKNVQKFIFDKFYREQRSNIHDVKGHGLGLSYVKKIVEHHHGIVYVESEKGKGSTFTIKLPLI
ncbi:HAMP domain-containing histidine kinase [Flavobacteriaceae bacterium F08102]|nr:HAMP domain-containing histidine kinase [Flavobacteriaceae bacterium F08102]